jgi:hypothetical protein
MDLYVRYLNDLIAKEKYRIRAQYQSHILQINIGIQSDHEYLIRICYQRSDDLGYQVFNGSYIYDVQDHNLNHNISLEGDNYNLPFYCALYWFFEEAST